MSDQTTIEVKNLGKYFGDIKAVDDISFNVSKGEVLGFLGPNGAGKSTTMKILSCFISPDFGTALINGKDIINSPEDVKKIIGYLPENAPLYDEMTVNNFLSFIASVREIPCKAKLEALNRVYDLVSLKDVKNQIIGTLSKGFKRRVGLAQAILHDPKVLILDEPTDGLDPNQKHEVRQLIKTMAENKIIILSTHILEEVDEVCTRAIIISKGKIVSDSTPDNLRKKSITFGMVQLNLVDNKNLDQLLEYFKVVSEVERIEIINNKINFYPKSGKEIINSIINTCKTKSLSIESINIDRGNLAEVFRKITV